MCIQDNFMSFNTNNLYMGSVLSYTGYIITKNKYFLCMKLCLDILLYFSVSVVDDIGLIFNFPIIIDIMQLSLISNGIINI